MTPMRTIKLLVTASLVACGGGEPGTTMDHESPVAALIAAPSEGATVDAPVTIQLDVRNLTIRPAGTDEPNTGHHHLFINRDIVAEGEVILTGPGIVHLGAGQTQHVLDEPGSYTVIAVLGDHAHVRIPGAATDTLRFSLR